jgi:hypothetical protein
MARKYRIKKLDNAYLIEMSQGKQWKPCDKFGLWHHEPMMYRNEFLANLNKQYFENRTFTKIIEDEQSDPIL